MPIDLVKCTYKNHQAFTTGIDLNATLNCAQKQLPSRCEFTMVLCVCVCVEGERISYESKSVLEGIERKV